MPNTSTSNHRREAAAFSAGDDTSRLHLTNAAFEESPDLLFVLNSDGYPLHFNKHCLQHLLYSEEAIRNHHISRVISPNPNMPDARKQVMQALKANRSLLSLHWTAIRQNGTQFPVDVSITPLPPGYQLHNQVASTLITVRNDSERLAFEERIKHLAYYDPVTGLINRNLLEDRARQAIYRAKRSQGIMAMLFLDLDFFKQVNDQYGHMVGDHLLKAAGLRIQSIMRNEDTLGRLGGDEFLILAEGISYTDDALMIGEKIINTLAEPFGIDGHRVQIGASVGIALYPEHGRVIKTLLNHADKAMYRAKELGRNKLAVYNSAVC